ncbi:putative mannose transporter, GGP family [Acidisarcina polymorpha]|uniref:Putative mannose transporter, GGP family n=1 Tax=Acidisarcina polymorpha TaxID=2211140 RepID=A0A2Z5FY55_9BACT|nr:sugar MFS transporter [Acidisarcina polymorpha]AXC11833.1 putative mannose transporter, GGP family [Acidisarcina polymorpha]
MAIASVGKTATTTKQPASTNTSAMAVVTTLFFMWGFLTCLNDILIPHLKAIFDLNYAQVMLVQLAFFLSYAVFAFPAGKIVEWIGYKRTMVIGLLTMAVGALCFIPAANVPSYPLFLGAEIVLAAGVTVLQVSANPFVSVLGPERTASSRLNLTQAFNSLGTTIAPWIGGALILSAAPKTTDEVRAMSATALQAYRLHEASTVKFPYLAISLALVLLAIAIALFKLPRIETTRDFRPQVGDKPDSIWSYPHLILGALAIFLYVGAEVSIGSFLVNYFSHPDTGNMTEQTAAKLVSLYWGGAMIGRFIGSAVLQKVRPNRALGVVAIVACTLVSVSILSVGHLAVWSILLVGLFNSIMFPTIFTLGIAELGPLTGEGSGILVASIVGGAILPYLEGRLADAIGIHHAFIIPAVCYIYLAYYGFRGSRPSRTAVA